MLTLFLDKKPTVEETVMILYPAVPAHLQIFVLDDVPDKRVTLEAAHSKFVLCDIFILSEEMLTMV